MGSYSAKLTAGDTWARAPFGFRGQGFTGRFDVVVVVVVVVVGGGGGGRAFRG